MDIIGFLPPELSQKIFLFLSVRELFNCMAVCKYWRSIIDCEYIWNNFIKVLDLEESNDLSDSDSSDTNCSNQLPPLSSKAAGLKTYLLSPANNWRNCEFKHTSVYLKFRHWKVACSDSHLAIMYILVNELHTYRIVKDGLLANDIITVNLPQNSIEQPMLMNSKYIILGAFNVTLIYKLVEKKFTLFRAYALKYDPVLNYAVTDFDDFVRKYLLVNHCVFDRALLDDTIWITDALGNKHIIDLVSGKSQIFSTLCVNTKVLPYSPFVLNYVDVHVLITDRKATTVSSFTIQHPDKSFYMNSRVICVCCPRFVVNNEINIECRKISSGELIRVITVPERTRITLHTSKDLLLSLSTLSNLYTVVSTCIKTGSILWKYNVFSGPHMFWGSYLYLIGGRFLVVYPGPSGDDFFALFNMKGELLYESSISPGVIIYFSESVVVAKEEGRLCVMICK